MSIEPLRLPDPVDQIVGANIRQRRHELKISQEALATGLDLTFQQVQKYESGANRVSSSKLFRAAKILRCNVTDLFKGCDEATPAVEIDIDQDNISPKSWIDMARRVDDLNPRLIEKLSRLDRAQSADIERFVNHMLPATGDKAAA